MGRASTSPASRSARASLASERARAELFALPARLFSKLPLETRIELQHSATKQVFVWTSGRHSELVSAQVKGGRREQPRPAEARARAYWLDGNEVDAVVLGLEAERTFSSDLTAFSLRKMHDPGFRVTQEHALAGAEAPCRAGRGPTLGEVLAALELDLLSIELGSEVEAHDGLGAAA